jgi:hypothetical protein
MKLTKLDVVDWEPCVLRFIFDRSPKPFANEFENFVRRWLQFSRKACSCEYRYADVYGDFLQKAIVVKSEWLCEICAEELTRAVDDEFPGLQKVELGLDVPELTRRSQKFLQVPPKKVQMENGECVSVSLFSIARRPVTIAEFAEFVGSTGYITLAEQEGSAETFREHSGLSGLSARVRSEVPAQFVAPSDAQAFCEHFRCRLPTEAEWLAAAVIDQGERELNTLEELRMLSSPVPDKLIDVKDWDITATHVTDGRVIARRGPHRFLKKGWREHPLFSFNRRLIGTSEYDMSITFRIVKLSE